MGKRLVGGGAALGLAVGLLATALVAASGAGDEGPPEPLPVLGATSPGGGAPAATQEDAARMSVAGGVTYEVAGDLPALDGEASAWSVDDPDDVDARIRALADRLGISGELEKQPVAEDSIGAWRIRSGTRVLEVYPYGGLPWNLYDESGAGSVGVACDSEGVCEEPERPADLPSAEEAEAIGRDLLGDAVDGADVQVSDGITSWYVSFDPVVGGLPTIGMASSVGIGPRGQVQFASGWLGEAHEGDRYPLVGTAEALRRLEAQAPLAIDTPAIACEPGPAVDCVPPEAITVTITGVRLGLQLIDRWLVPSYLFAVDGGGPGSDLPTVAVADEFLVAPEPEPQPAPDPGADPPVTIEPVPPTEPSGQCAESVGTGEQPLVLSVCVDPARAGEPAAVTVSISDPDAAVRNDCGSPVVAFGDESGGTAVCEIGCVPSTEPGSGSGVDRGESHVWAEPGDYTVEVAAESNCGEAPGERLTVSVPVTVTG